MFYVNILSGRLDYMPMPSQGKGIAPLLTSLKSSVYGGLDLGLAKYDYYLNVENPVGSIIFTPTAIHSSMVMKVNDVLVKNGQASQPVDLAVGVTPISISVASVDGSMLTTYTVNVTRKAPPSYLSSLVIKDDSDEYLTILPAFSPSILNYSASVGSFVASVTITPISANPSDTVKVNGNVVIRNSSSEPIELTEGLNTIVVIVGTTAYRINLTKNAAV